MNTRVGISLALAALLWPVSVSGQAALQPQSRPPSEAEKTAKLVLYPAAEPRPALKYQLLPPFLERRPGNAAVWWNRLPAEQHTLFAEYFKEGGVWIKGREWMEIPLGDPREKDRRKSVLALSASLSASLKTIFSDMERAARFESCDWQLPIREGNLLSLLLPELQQTRGYGRMLTLKARLEIVEGKYDEAVRTIQTGYALARHVAQGPTLIHSLVGVTIAEMMSQRVEDLIQQPDAPNLYWALSALPRPLVDFRPGYEVEQHSLYLTLPELRDLDKKDLSPEQWRNLLLRTGENLFGLVTSLDRRSPPADAAVAAALVLQGYPRAKRFLIEQGRSAAEVEAMPVAQVVLLYTVRVYNELRDEQFKWLILPHTEARIGMGRAQRSLTETAREREIIPLAAILLPALGAAKSAETRTQWNVAMLRVFEAMRLYAASHGGRWPDRLSDMVDVPIPVNPYDGKPFGYQRLGNKAVLTCEDGPPGPARRYEITLGQKGK